MISDPLEKAELRWMWHESNAYLDAIREREQKAIADKRYDLATEIAYLRIEEQKKNTQILGQLTGAL